MRWSYKQLTQSLLSHVHNDVNISFQLKLDQALVQSSDKDVRYLFDVLNKNTKHLLNVLGWTNPRPKQSNHDQAENYSSLSNKICMEISGKFALHACETAIFNKDWHNNNISYRLQSFLAPSLLVTWSVLIRQDEELCRSWKSWVQGHQQLILSDPRHLRPSQHVHTKFELPLNLGQ